MGYSIAVVILLDISYMGKPIQPILDGKADYIQKEIIF